MIEKNLYSVNGKGIVADNIKQAIEMYEQWVKVKKDMGYRPEEEILRAEKVDKYKAGITYDDKVLWQI